MDRVIFCPSEDMIDDASHLSKIHLLPILLGDNERTKNLEFDRSKPSPLSIPVSHFFKLEPEQPIVNQRFSITYKNEFINLNDGISFTLFSHIVGEPNGHHLLRMNEHDRHIAYAYITVGVPADFSFFVWKNDEKLFSFDFSVKDIL